MEELTATIHGVKGAKVAYEFRSVELLSPTLLTRRNNDLRISQADALKDAASELRTAVREVESLVSQRAPFAAFAASVQAARESLTQDLSVFFHNVELYRSTVFSHTTKDSIATLGIGKQLDALESEFNEDDKSRFTAEAIDDLFPALGDLEAKTATRIAHLSEKLRDISESVRKLRTDNPGDNYNAIEVATSSSRAALQSEIMRNLQSEVDRLCGGANTAVTRLVINAKADFDREMRGMKAVRRKRYYVIAAVTAAVVAALYFGYLYWATPSPKSTPGNLLLGVASGLIVEFIVLSLVKWRESIPKLIAQTKQKFQAQLVQDVRQATTSELDGHKFEALNEVALASRLNQEYAVVLSAAKDSWHISATESLRVLRTLQADYAALRSDYLSSIEEIRQQCVLYFADSSKNLETLNAIAKRIKEYAIEPSFKLLDETRQQLETVKQQIERVEFT